VSTSSASKGHVPIEGEQKGVLAAAAVQGAGGPAPGGVWDGCVSSSEHAAQPTARSVETVKHQAWERGYDMTAPLSLQG
jgi:hypothetical protein